MVVMAVPAVESTMTAAAGDCDYECDWLHGFGGYWWPRLLCDVWLTTVLQEPVGSYSCNMKCGHMPQCCPDASPLQLWGNCIDTEPSAAPPHGVILCFGQVYANVTPNVLLLSTTRGSH